MKYSEMDARQKKAFRNIVGACDNIVGELENTVSDCAGEEWADNAQALLDDHEKLVERIYEAVISEIHEAGRIQFGAGVERVLKDIRFCGKEWLVARIDARLVKMGY